MLGGCQSTLPLLDHMAYLRRLPSLPPGAVVQLGKELEQPVEELQERRGWTLGKVYNSTLVQYMYK